MPLGLSVCDEIRSRVGSNGPSVKMSKVYYGAVANEHLLESPTLRPPIDHRT